VEAPVAKPRGPSPRAAPFAPGVPGLIWRNKRWFKFISEVATEVSQVTWPTRAETRAATIVVIVLTIVCSIILAIMDLFWSNVTDWLYSL